MNYLEMVRKANKGELSAKDINAVVLTFAENEKRQNKDIEKNGRGIRDIEEEYPLLPSEGDDISNAVKRKGVEILGGKNSPAYKNTDLRKKLYMDIYGEIKRQYGLIDEKGRQKSYKKLKRKYISGALSVIETYEPPIAIANDIESENELGDMD